MLYIKELRLLIKGLKPICRFECGIKYLFTQHIEILIEKIKTRGRKKLKVRMK